MEDMRHLSTFSEVEVLSPFLFASEIKESSRRNSGISDCIFMKIVREKRLVLGWFRQQLLCIEKLWVIRPQF